MTPEEKLCSRWWRLRHGAWMLTCFLSVGLLTWVAYLWIGVRAKNGRWLLFSGLWFLAFLTWAVGTSFIDTGTKEAPIKSPAGDALALFLFVGYIGGIVHVVVTNRSWLRWLAHNGGKRKAWYIDAAEKPAPVMADSLLPDAAEQILRGGMAAGQSNSPQSAFPLPVSADLNSASSADLISVLGLDSAWADRVLTTRERLGRFSNPDQLLTEAHLPPHVYQSIRSRVTVGDSIRHSPSAGTNARQLDL